MFTVTARKARCFARCMVLGRRDYCGSFSQKIKSTILGTKM
jgi:hypothetical protein